MIELGHLVVEFASDGLAVTEMLLVRNSDDETYIGRGPAVASGKTATLRFPLPPGAKLVNVSESLMRCCVMTTDEGLVDTMPVMPGTRTVLYVYTVPYEGRTWDLRRAFAYPTGGLHVFLADGVVEVDVPGFSQEGGWRPRLGVTCNGQADHWRPGSLW